MISPTLIFNRLTLQPQKTAYCFDCSAFKLNDAAGFWGCKVFLFNAKSDEKKMKIFSRKPKSGLHFDLFCSRNENK